MTNFHPPHTIQCFDPPPPLLTETVLLVALCINFVYPNEVALWCQEQIPMLHCPQKLQSILTYNASKPYLFVSYGTEYKKGLPGKVYRYTIGQNLKQSHLNPSSELILPYIMNKQTHVGEEEITEPIMLQSIDKPPVHHGTSLLGFIALHY